MLSSRVASLTVIIRSVAAAALGAMSFAAAAVAETGDVRSLGPPGVGLVGGAVLILWERTGDPEGDAGVVLGSLVPPGRADHQQIVLPPWLHGDDT